MSRSLAPAVRRMVLFKHGVAHVERGGPADGPFELAFRREEMNDVLRSLAVWVVSGDARPGAVAFDKPENPEQALAEKGLDLPADKTLVALVTALRGRRAAIVSDSGTIEGEIVGIDTRAVEDGWAHAVLVREPSGDVQVKDLARVTAVRPIDASARADLEFLLDRRRAATSHERRALRVALSGPAKDVRVAYVVPAPVWRVSYRVSIDAREEGRAAIAGWAVVHNPLDEDAADIALTLTTGQPVSFDIDLYHPKRVERVVVEEATRATAGPTSFERAPRPQAAMRKMAIAAAPAAAPAAFGAPSPAMAPGGGGFGPPPMQAMAMLDEGAAPSVEVAERGELFEYRISEPITLERGGSALVPILASRLEARKERIWRAGSPPAPDLVITFKNESGAVLEEGPATVYDDGVYAGESMVPYSARGTDVKLGYAKDLAVRCSSKVHVRDVLMGVRLQDVFAMEDLRREEHHTLRAESDHDEPVDVIFELPRTTGPGRGLHPGHAQPFEETAHYRRFRLTVPPHGVQEMVVVDLAPTFRRVDYPGLTPAQMDRWLEQGVLDGRLKEGLGRAIELWATASAHERAIQEREREKQAQQTAQTKIAEQLRVLKEGGPEGELRLRYVAELGQAQDRIHAIDRDMEGHREGARVARNEAQATIARLVSMNEPRPPGR